MERRKAKRIVLLVIFLLCVLVFSIIMLWRNSRDKVPPVISMDDDSILVSKTDVEQVLNRDYGCLLNGVTAVDDRDGDLSDKVIVYSFNSYNDDSYAIVKYKVMDKGGNVGTATRLVYIKTPQEIYNDAVNNYAAFLEKTIDEQKSQNTDGTIPILEIENNIQITKGENFNIMNYIIRISDDKDPESYLIEHGRFEGKLDVNVSGVYPMAFYIQDSDGNESAAAICVITVVEN